MIKDFVNKWNKNKEKLENYFRITKQEEYDKYEKIVKKIIELVINGDNDDLGVNYDYKNMTVLDYGNYQGTQIFVIPQDTYQPDVDDIIYTSNYYGSCSGCDTLLGISSYDSDLPNEQQVKDYMTLSLHLIQRLNYFVVGEEDDE